MDWLLIIVGVLAFLTAFIHIFAGGRDVAEPLLRSPLEAEAKYTLYVCWHFISVFFVASASILLLSGVSGAGVSADLAVFMAALWVVAGIIFLVVSWRINGLRGVLRLPQWTLLVFVGVLILFGSM